MKTNIQKIMSGLMIGMLITSQIGCASKATKISAPLDQVKFEKDYKYTVKLKTGEQNLINTGDLIQTKANKLIIQTPTQSKSLMSHEIERVDGVGTKSVGSYAGKGFLIGGSLGVVLIGAIILVNRNDCSQPSEDNFECGEIQPSGYVLLPMLGGLVVGGLGALIGGLAPRYERIQITPIIEPTTSGVNAGGNLQVKF